MQPRNLQVAVLFVLLLVISAYPLILTAPIKAKQPNELLAKQIAKELLYPGARDLGDSRQYDNVYLGTFVTSDEVNSVIDWYQEKIGRAAKPRTQGVTWRGTEGVAIAHDSDQPPTKTKGKLTSLPRLVTVSVFTQRQSSHTASVTVSQGKGEEHTHIVLTVMRNLEY